MGDDNELNVLITETGHIDERILSGDKVRPGCLGRLGGPIADWAEGTRNGRLYSRDLWVKVFSTPWVKEALETKTLFGEADHPDERLESKLSLAAVTMVDYEFLDDQQILYGWFDILDTPSGRILRTLADYGCRLGVSSRGRGKIITRGNQQVVEEDSYLFGGFDIVALPAVKKARQNFVAENLDMGNIDKSIKDQIQDCRTSSELEVIKDVLESSEIEGLNDYLSLIESKSNELLSSDNTIVERLTGELQKSYSEINKIKSRKIHRSRPKIDAINEATERMDRENVKLFSDLYEENSRLKSELILKDEKINSMDDGLSEKIRELETQVEQLNQKNESLIKRAKSFDRLKSTNEVLEEEKQSLRSKVRELSLRLKSETEDYNSLVDSYNELSDENERLSSEYEDALESYLVFKCSQVSDLTPKMAHRLLPEDYSIEDIDCLVKNQANLRRRMNKLPIYSSQLDEQRVVYRDSEDTELDESLEGLSTLLQSMKKNK